jgi:hypothetical protein
MRHFALRWLRKLLGFLGVLSVACLALLDTSRSRRKDGILVEPSDELAESGVAIRDWRRSGLGVLDVQISTPIQIPGHAWTLAAYDKNGKLLASGRVLGPQARERDVVWIRLATPYRDLFDKADTVVIGADFSALPPQPER